VDLESSFSRSTDETLQDDSVGLEESKKVFVTPPTEEKEENERALSSEKEPVVNEPLVGLLTAFRSSMTSTSNRTCRLGRD
jgi:hypothetical protein